MTALWLLQVGAAQATVVRPVASACSGEQGGRRFVTRNTTRT